MPRCASTRSGSSGSRVTKATTVEQIAAAAEVSPSTFFRYFPTKEDVVIQDDMDTRLFAAFERQPPELGPGRRAARRAARGGCVVQPGRVEQLREASALQMTVPEIRARILDDMNRLMHLMTEALAKRTGRAADDLAVRTFAGAVIGTMMSASLPYHQMAESGLDGGGGGPVRADRRGARDVEAGLPL